MYLVEEGIKLAQVHEKKELPEGTASFYPTDMDHCRPLTGRPGKNSLCFSKSGCRQRTLPVVLFLRLLEHPAK